MTPRERAHAAVRCFGVQDLAGEEAEHDPLCDRATAAITAAVDEALGDAERTCRDSYGEAGANLARRIAALRGKP